MEGKSLPRNKPWKKKRKCSANKAVNVSISWSTWRIVFANSNNIKLTQKPVLSAHLLSSCSLLWPYVCFLQKGARFNIGMACHILPYKNEYTLWNCARLRQIAPHANDPEFSQISKRQFLPVSANCVHFVNMRSVDIFVQFLGLNNIEQYWTLILIYGWNSMSSCGFVHEDSTIQYHTIHPIIYPLYTIIIYIYTHYYPLYTNYIPIMIPYGHEAIYQSYNPFSNLASNSTARSKDLCCFSDQGSDDCW